MTAKHCNEAMGQATNLGKQRVRHDLWRWKAGMPTALLQELRIWTTGALGHSVPLRCQEAKKAEVSAFTIK